MNLPGSEEFRSSSSAHRLLMADAGLLMFAHDPITGVGWQRSPDEVRSAWLNDELRRRWEGEIAETLFPRTLDHGATVHNTYVQILAEAGVVGFVTFLAAVIAIGIGLFRLLRDARADPSLFVSTRAAMILLVATMVWLNDNPLFGSQPESVMAAMFLGILAAVPPILATRDDHVRLTDRLGVGSRRQPFSAVPSGGSAPSVAWPRPATVAPFGADQVMARAGSAAVAPFGAADDASMGAGSAAAAPFSFRRRSAWRRSRRLRSSPKPPVSALAADWSTSPSSGASTWRSSSSAFRSSFFRVPRAVATSRIPPSAGAERDGVGRQQERRGVDDHERVVGMQPGEHLVTAR